MGSLNSSSFSNDPKFSTEKRVNLLEILRSQESNPRMGDPLGSSRVSSQKQNHEGVRALESGRPFGQPSVGDGLTSPKGGGSYKPYIPHESNPRMGDPLGSSCVSSQKQNREGVVGPKADNIVLQWSQARDVVGARAGM
ncbi:unnamed protein product [Malus baccata var. baccata]